MPPYIYFLYLFLITTPLNASFLESIKIVTLTLNDLAEAFQGKRSIAHLEKTPEQTKQESAQEIIEQLKNLITTFKKNIAQNITPNKQEIDYYNKRYAQYLIDGFKDNQSEFWYYGANAYYFFKTYQNFTLPQITQATNSPNDQTSLEDLTFFFEGYQRLLNTGKTEIPDSYETFAKNYKNWLDTLQKPAKTTFAERQKEKREQALAQMNSFVKQFRLNPETAADDIIKYTTAIYTFELNGGRPSAEFIFWNSWGFLSHILKKYTGVPIEKIAIETHLLPDKAIEILQKDLNDFLLQKSIGSHELGGLTKFTELQKKFQLFINNLKNELKEPEDKQLLIRTGEQNKLDKIITQLRQTPQVTQQLYDDYINAYSLYRKNGGDNLEYEMFNHWILLSLLMTKNKGKSLDDIEIDTISNQQDPLNYLKQLVSDYQSLQSAATTAFWMQPFDELLTSAQAWLQDLQTSSAEPTQTERDQAQTTIQQLIDTQLKKGTVTAQIIDDYQKAYTSFIRYGGTNDTFKFWSYWLLLTSLMQTHKDQSVEEIALARGKKEDTLIPALKKLLSSYTSLQTIAVPSQMTQEQFNSTATQFGEWIDQLEKNQKIKRTVDQKKEALDESIAQFQSRDTEYITISELVSFLTTYQEYKKIASTVSNTYQFWSTWAEAYLKIKSKVDNLAELQRLEAAIDSWKDKPEIPVSALQSLESNFKAYYAQEKATHLQSVEKQLKSIIKTKFKIENPKLEDLDIELYKQQLDLYKKLAGDNEIYDTWSYWIELSQRATYLLGKRCSTMDNVSLPEQTTIKQQVQTVINNLKTLQEKLPQAQNIPSLLNQLQTCFQFGKQDDPINATINTLSALIPSVSKDNAAAIDNYLQTYKQYKTASTGKTVDEASNKKLTYWYAYALLMRDTIAAKQYDLQSIASRWFNSIDKTNEVITQYEQDLAFFDTQKEAALDPNIGTLANGMFSGLKNNLANRLNDLKRQQQMLTLIKGPFQRDVTETSGRVYSSKLKIPWTISTQPEDYTKYHDLYEQLLIKDTPPANIYTYWDYRESLLQATLGYAESQKTPKKATEDLWVKQYNDIKKLLWLPRLGVSIDPTQKELMDSWHIDSLKTRQAQQFMDHLYKLKLNLPQNPYY